jgi:hypothetical protein
MPLLFISHKHSDKPTADVLARFIFKQSAGRITVHSSSNPEFQGPKLGKNLNSQLRNALSKTEVLILLYTSADKDWQYCMLECGMSMHPQSLSTTQIVFQCGIEAPPPFQDSLRVNPRRFDDIKRFTDQLLRDPEMFPSTGPIAPDLKDSNIQESANELFSELAKVLPDESWDQWPTWPYLRLEMPNLQSGKIEAAAEADLFSITRQIVCEYAVVAQSDARAAQLFGKQSLPPQVKFRQLLDYWTDKYPAGDQRWFDSCCEQIMVCVRRGLPVICRVPMRELAGDSSYTPTVTRVKRLPSSGTVQFDLYFFNLSDPRAISVTSRMIPVADLFYKRESDMDTLRLMELIQELEMTGRNRVPILASNGGPLFVVHRSMIEQFIVPKLLRKEEVGTLTLKHLLDEPKFKSTFEKSFVVVSNRSTLADAKAAMVAREACSDVFVTDTGVSANPVIGLLTNVEITRNI